MNKLQDCSNGVYRKCFTVCTVDDCLSLIKGILWQDLGFDKDSA